MNEVFVCKINPLLHLLANLSVSPNLKKVRCDHCVNCFDQRSKHILFNLNSPSFIRDSSQDCGSLPPNKSYPVGVPLDPIWDSMGQFVFFEISRIQDDRTDPQDLSAVALGYIRPILYMFWNSCDLDLIIIKTKVP